MFSDFPFGLQVKCQTLVQASTQVCLFPLASSSNTSLARHWPFLCPLALVPCPLLSLLRLIPFLQIRTLHSFRLAANVIFSEEPSPTVPPLRSTLHAVWTSRESPHRIRALCVHVCLSHQTLCSHRRAWLHVRGTGHTNAEWIGYASELREGRGGFGSCSGVVVVGGRSLRRPKGINSASSSCFPFSSHYHIEQWPVWEIKIGKTVLPESELTTNIYIVVLKHYWDKANWGGNF